MSAWRELALCRRRQPGRCAGGAATRPGAASAPAPSTWRRRLPWPLLCNLQERRLGHWRERLRPLRHSTRRHLRRPRKARECANFRPRRWCSRRRVRMLRAVSANHLRRRTRRRPRSECQWRHRNHCRDSRRGLHRNLRSGLYSGLQRRLCCRRWRRCRRLGRRRAAVAQRRRVGRVHDICQDVLQARRQCRRQCRRRRRRRRLTPRALRLQEVIHPAQQRGGALGGPSAGR